MYAQAKCARCGYTDHVTMVFYAPMLGGRQRRRAAEAVNIDVWLCDVCAAKLRN